ncbi:MAG TPA: 2-dehydropantoate 2-reductase [Alphaproteobacteria bacterium]|nr:2-dehydropantoate 2-reductase [Alphaproteobacteria bacterium]
MRILVVGAGATGGLFGGLLAHAGRDVTFLVRAARAAQLREGGLQIRGPRGDVTVAPQIAQAETIASAYDVVLLGLKAYALASAIEDFAPAVGPQTLILPMLNGMRHLDVLAQRFGKEHVLGGVCIVASTLDSEGRILQLNEAQQLIYGTQSGERTPRVVALDQTLQGAGFTATLSDHIIHDMWEKWVFLASLAASTTLLGGSVGSIVAAGGEPVIARIFDECASVARASGNPPRDAFLKTLRPRLTEAGLPLTASMYRDMQAGSRVEADHILGDLLARARAFDLPAPLLEAAYVHLNVYQRGLIQHS